MTRVLLVDDDSIVLDTLCQILEAAGYDVQPANSGAVGLQSYQLKRPDVVITDVIMPEMDGIEFIQRLRDIDPGAKIIAISGGSGRGYFENLEAVRRLTPVAILPKPFAKATLLSLIERCVSEGAIERARAATSADPLN
jgi:two-component system chemotaxis response regulator CheY